MTVRAANRIGKLAPMNLRTTAELRVKIERAASEAGRSLTAEIMHRLEQSFDREALLEDVRRAVAEQSRTQELPSWALSPHGC